MKRTSVEASRQVVVEFLIIIPPSLYEPLLATVLIKPDDGPGESALTGGFSPPLAAAPEARRIDHRRWLARCALLREPYPQPHAAHA